MAGSETSYSPPSLRDVSRVLFRHRRKALGVFFGTLVVVVASTAFMPRKYLSEARLFVRVGRESIALDPTATMGKTIDVDTTRESEIRSVLDVLKSRVLIERVVDDFGPERLLGGHASDGVLKQVLRPVLGLPKLSTREKAIAELRERVQFDVGKNSSVLSVSSKASSPKRAQEIVALLVDVFLEEHARLHRSEKSHEFFQQQSALLKQQLTNVTQALRDAKDEVGVATVVSRQQSLEAQILETETQKLQTEHALAAANERIASLQRELKTLPNLVAQQQTNGVPHAGADYMRQQLYELEIRERELLSKFTEDDPQVIAIREQLAAARNIFDQQQQTRTQSVSSINPVWQELQLSLLRDVSQADALRAKLQVLAGQHAGLLARIKELNQAEITIAELERQAASLESNYRTYLDNLEQSRIDQALLGERITNVNLVQPASFSDNPVSPRVKLTLLLGLLIAAAGAVGAALLAEYLNHTLATPDELEELLGISVLASLPVLETRKVSLN